MSVSQTKVNVDMKLLKETPEIKIRVKTNDRETKKKNILVTEPSFNESTPFYLTCICE